MSKPNKYTPHNGKKECERRIKQFEKWFAKQDQDKLKQIMYQSIIPLGVL